jgi:hypothetical protein
MLRTLELHLDGDRIVGRFTQLSAGYFEIEIVEPLQGEVYGHSHRFMMEGLAFAAGHGRRYLDATGAETPLLMKDVERALRRYLPRARFVAEERDRLLARRERIVARLEAAALAVGPLDEAAYQAELLILETQRQAGMSWKGVDRRKQALERRREVTRQVTELWPVRLVQHVQDRYGMELTGRELVTLLGSPDRPGQGRPGEISTVEPEHRSRR